MSIDLRVGDVREVLPRLPAGSVHCVVTSPPYWGLRDYGTGQWEGGDAQCDHRGPPKRTQAGFNERYFGAAAKDSDKQGELRQAYGAVCGKCGARRIDSQLGLEATPEEYIGNMVGVFREVRRVMREDATLWLNLGDSMASGGRKNYGPATGGKNSVLDGAARAQQAPGLKPKDLLGMPWRLALALQADGWWLRSDIIWAKPNPMPESVTDRPTKAHEYVFLLTKAKTYYYDADAVREGWARNYDVEKPRPRGESADGRFQTSCRAILDEGGIDEGGMQAHPAGRNLRSVWTGRDQWRLRHCPGWDEEEERCTELEGRCPCGGTGLLWTVFDREADGGSVWRIATQAYKEAHFATFPERLVVPCIKAGTSLKGCCPDCGAPWRRVVEKNRQATRPARDNVRDETGMANRDYERHVTESRTVGWEPGCGCHGSEVDGQWRWMRGINHEPIPCVVLDPFAGSGTVGKVARQLGRSFVGIELNPQYAEMAQRRMMSAGPVVDDQDDPSQALLFE